MLFNPRNAAQLLVFISGSDASEIPLMMKSISIGGSNGRRMLQEYNDTKININEVEFKETKLPNPEACKKRPGGHNCLKCFPVTTTQCVICSGYWFASYEGECKCPSTHIIFKDQCLPECPNGFRVKFTNDGGRSCEEETVCGYWMDRNELRNDCDPNWRFYTLIGVTVGCALLCIIFLIALCCYSGGFYRAIRKTHDIAKENIKEGEEEIQSQSEGDRSFKDVIKDEDEDGDHTNNSNHHEREGVVAL